MKKQRRVSKGDFFDISSKAELLKDWKNTQKHNVNMLVPHYIMASYAYYVLDDPLIPDTYFDQMAKRLLKNWDKITHWHKDYITIDDLKAGTYLGEYPRRATVVAETLLLGIEWKSRKPTPKKKIKKKKVADTTPQVSSLLGLFQD